MIFQFGRITLWNKKLLFLITAVFCTLTSYADKQKEIKLGPDRVADTVELSYCNIFVAKDELGDEENAKVMIMIENLEETNVLILFGHAYPEKELRKLSPSIFFDKQFPGTKGDRNIDTYGDLRGDLFLIEPTHKKTLPEFQMRSGEKQVWRFPLYIAKYKNSKGTKLLLQEKEIIELSIMVEQKPDQNYLRLMGDADSLVKDISQRIFCTNPKHRQSLELQEKPYKDGIEKINTEIDSIVATRNWYVTDKGYQRYNMIKQKLNSVSFLSYEKDCGIHKKKLVPRVPKHRCKYCGLSLQAIYLRLDRYYRKIDTSRKDKRKVKASVMPDVELLYRCSSDSKCANHSKEWSGSPYKSKITTCYNRIHKL